MSEHEGWQRTFLRAAEEMHKERTAPEAADQTRADVVLTEHDRFTLSDLFEANRFDRLCEAVERILAARDAEHAAEVEALRRSRDEWRATAFGLEDEKEAAEATVARVQRDVGMQGYRFCSRGCHSEALSIVRAALDGER